MTWISSIAVGVLTGVAGLLLSGVVANLAVGWYRISSFEGGAGYFVVALALLGLIAGIVIGVVASRMIGAGAHPGFLRALAVSLGIVAALGGSIGGVARLLADVPPEIDGERLLLAVELKWPANDSSDPASYPGVGYTRLGASAGRVVRKSEDGPLFVDLARKEGGQWIVPGVVRVFTSRGERILDIGIGAKNLGGFIIKLPKNPGAAERQWSEWAPPLPDMFTYRFRVILTSEPSRVDSIGPFEVATIAGGFYRVPGPERLAAASSFRIGYRGAPISELEDADAVSVVAGPTTALLVHVNTPAAPDACFLVTDEAGAARLQNLTTCAAPIEASPLTADPARLAAVGTLDVVRGWIDRETFLQPGLYELSHGVLDTRTLTFRALSVQDDPYRISGLPPASLSPDERSFVWFTHRDGEEDPVLGVTDWRADSSYILPIDRTRMRFNDYRAIGPAWVGHHFAWVRGPDGIDRLAARERFAPLPYRGDLTVGKPGEYASYALRPGGKALRQAMVDVLVNQMGAERMPDEMDGYYLVVKLDGKLVKAAIVETGGYVSFGMDYGATDPELVTRVATALDAAIATGQYDPLFRPDA